MKNFHSFIFIVVITGALAAPNTKFYLFRRSETLGTILNADTVPGNFDRSKETYVLIHGLGGHFKDLCVSNLSSALLSTRDVNIIIPDYQVAAMTYTFMYRTVAAEISHFLKSNAIPERNTAVMGMSLGAQVAGILYRTGFKPALIIGLDPAGPQFSTMPTSSKLTPLSADSVQVVHTNVGGLGSTTLDGHSDIFINKGTDFPCCNSQSCRHIGSCHWMAKTILNGPATSVLCNSQFEASAGRCYGAIVPSGFGTQQWSTTGRTIAHVSLDQCVPSPKR